MHSFIAQFHELFGYFMGPTGVSLFPLFHAASKAPLTDESGHFSLNQVK
jgi:hypothetical protein